LADEGKFGWASSVIVGSSSLVGDARQPGALRRSVGQPLLRKEGAHVESHGGHIDLRR
jgi:hypothetical protein